MRILAIAQRVLKEVLRDKRTLALMFLAPIVIMWLLNVMFSANSTTNVKLATVNVNQTVRQNLDNTKHVAVQTFRHNQTAQDRLKNHQVDGVILFHDNKYDVTYANTDSSKTTLTKQALKAALTKQTMTTLTGTIKQLQTRMAAANPQMASQLQQHKAKAPQISNHYNYGDSNTGFFAKIIPILMGFFIFLFVFLVSGMALLHERTSGTLSRLLATPVKRSEIVYGYMISYGIVAIAQSIVIVLATIWLLKIEVVGSIISIVLISLLFALVALAFGILMSTLANSEFQMMQFIPLVVVPQVFFSGIIPLDSMATWVQYIGKILPLTYTGDALTKIVMEGTPLTQLGGDILALFIFLIILIVLNIIGLKRYRKV
ncbi:ABC transporter permease [Limosilactobacillus sp.]|uniref:ABC transporter permease n=1 Tax=Limosilactobacillus sp. TaxID=2773925 RepID=UPI00345E45DD